MVKKKWIGLIVFMAVMVVLTNVNPSSVFAQQEEPNQPGTKVEEINIQLNDDYFNPEEIIIPKGKMTKLVLKNKGKKEHTFTVERLGVDVELQPGKERTITLKPENPGTYELICRYHVKEGMVGKVIVK